MEIKTWVSVGILYVVLVFGGYSLVTGNNPFQSGELEHEGYHTEEKQMEQDTMVHQHHDHPVESEVRTSVTYNDGKISIALEDNSGAALELVMEHEKEMHFIIVSNDLETYYHLHPEQVQEGIYAVNQSLNEGSYQAFVDIVPEDKAYQVEPNTVQVGTNETGKASLQSEDDWTKEIDGKTVTLENVNATVGEEVPLVFDLHGEMPDHYLGALGHVVIVDEDAEQYIHVHPASDDTTTFYAHFPKTGMYKIWAEFKFGEDVHVYPFIIKVTE